MEHFVPDPTQSPHLPDFITRLTMKMSSYAGDLTWDKEQLRQRQQQILEFFRKNVVKK